MFSSECRDVWRYPCVFVGQRLTLSDCICYFPNSEIVFITITYHMWSGSHWSWRLRSTLWLSFPCLLLCGFCGLYWICQFTRQVLLPMSNLNAPSSLLKHALSPNKELTSSLRLEPQHGLGLCGLYLLTIGIKGMCTVTRFFLLIPRNPVPYPYVMNTLQVSDLLDLKLKF